MSPATPGCLATESLTCVSPAPASCLVSTCPVHQQRAVRAARRTRTARCNETGHSYIKYHKRHHFLQIRLFFHASMDYFSIFESYLLDVRVVKVGLQFLNFTRQLSPWPARVRADSCQASAAHHGNSPSCSDPGPPGLYCLLTPSVIFVDH